MVRLRTFGTLQIEAENQAAATLSSQVKPLGLFLYLAAARPVGPHRRDRLLGLLWPELDDARGRHALRQASYIIRQSLGSDIFAPNGGDTLGLDSQVVEADWNVFEAAIAEHRLADALNVYRGEWLAGFHMRGARDFSDWLDLERARLRDLARGAALTLAQEALAKNRGGDAARWSERALSIDPYSELAVQLLTTALDRSGDRTGAIRAAHSFESRLMDDLELEPGPETKAVFEEIASRMDANGSNAVLLASSEADAVAGAVGMETVPTTQPRWSPRRVAVLVVVAATVLITITALRSSQRAPSDAVVSTRVLVLPFANETGDAELDAVGRIAESWVTQNIFRGGFVRVMSPSAAGLNTHEGSYDAEDRVAAAQRFRELGSDSPGLVVSGRYARRGDSLTFWVDLVTADGQMVGAVGPVTSGANDPMVGIDELSQRVSGLVAAQTDARPASTIVSTRSAPLFEAYLAYVDGLDAFLSGDRTRAAQRLMDAWSLDTTFTTPLFPALRLWSWARRRDMVDSVESVLMSRSASLEPAERYAVARWESDRRGDYAGALDAQRHVVAFIADDWTNSDLGTVAMRFGAYHEAARAFRQMDPNGALVVAAPQLYYKNLTATLHFLGEHEEELELATTFLEEGHNENSLTQKENPLGYALSALGRHEDLLAYYDEWFREHPERERVLLNQLVANMGRLSRHGYFEGAERVFADWLRRSGEGVDATTLARAYYHLHRWEQAAAIFDSLVPRPGADIANFADANNRTGWAIVAARVGRPQTARDISTALESFRPGQPGTAFMRARIAAAIGDRDVAIALLRTALEGGMMHMSLHTSTQDFELLWDDPEYRALVGPQDKPEH